MATLIEISSPTMFFLSTKLKGWESSLFLFNFINLILSIITFTKYLKDLTNMDIYNQTSQGRKSKQIKNT